MDRTMSTANMHTSETVCFLAGITYRQMNYWIAQGWIEPVNGAHTGSGVKRYFTKDETRRVVLMAHLVAAGIKPEQACDLTLKGEYDDNAVFRAPLHKRVYVEVFP